MDPLRSETRPDQALGDVERDARIEQLLLAGLDEYFAHRYEHAISLWTRVLFLDRHHDRARAYIERARRAQAERQRECDALLHAGLDAFRAGDITRARQLLADALDRGASPDDAQGTLERIERLGAAQAAPKGRRRGMLAAAASTATPGGSHAAVPDRAHGWFAPSLLALAALGTVAVAMWGVTVPEPQTWSIFAPAPAPEVVRWVPEPLPIAYASERHLSRARSLAASGRLYDALAALDRIAIGDSLYGEANRLRAQLQQQLLALVPSTSRATP
jgi:hypothetical protein